MITRKNITGDDTVRSAMKIREANIAVVALRATRDRELARAADEFNERKSKIEAEFAGNSQPHAQSFAAACEALGVPEEHRATVEVDVEAMEIRYGAPPKGPKPKPARKKRARSKAKA